MKLTRPNPSGSNTRVMYGIVMTGKSIWETVRMELYRRLRLIVNGFWQKYRKNVGEGYGCELAPMKNGDER